MMKNNKEDKWLDIEQSVFKTISSAKTYNVNKISREIKKYMPEYKPALRFSNKV